MKNLLIYIGVKHNFDKEHAILAKIQIDNAYDLGWKKQDILLVTNFPYSYNGIESLVIPDGECYKFDKSSNKIPTIMYLIDTDVLTEAELYWYHDFDVYQLNPITEDELKLRRYDIGITPYGYKPQWNLGCIFFKVGARDIFGLIHHTILHNRKSNNRCDEKALKRLIVQNKISKDRYKELDVTYNITKRCLATNYRNAKKPIRSVHFHLWDKDDMMMDTALNMFMYGKNRLKMPLMNDRLINIFKHHGIS